MTKVLVLMALQPSFFNSFSQTWVHLWFALLTMGSTVAKCRSRRDKGLLFVYPRKEKIKQFLKNWRPITLLNTVYKIASSCIAARLKTVLPKLIGDDQKGFLKGKYIGENIRLLYDTLLYAKQHQIPSLLLMVDFEKAFDSVAWSFIEKSLCKFKFGKDITRWILTFYTNINSCVHVNGQYSQWFDVKRGTRQGDPLSPYLFLICAELLASMIRQNENIHGINILDEEILLSQFADDTTFFQSNVIKEDWVWL